MRRFSGSLLAVAVIAVLAAPSASSGSQTYFDLYMTGNQIAFSGYNYWQTNKVWRPIGNWFTVAFHNSTGDWGHQRSRDLNPVVATGPYGYSQGWCYNDSGNTVSPVTCAVYT